MLAFALSIKCNISHDTQAFTKMLFPIPSPPPLLLPSTNTQTLKKGWDSGVYCLFYLF